MWWKSIWWTVIFEKKAKYTFTPHIFKCLLLRYGKWKAG